MRGALGIAALRLSDGSMRWQLDLAEIRKRPLSWTVFMPVGPPSGEADFIAFVFREGTRVYASLADGALAAIDLDSGDVAWVSQPSGTAVSGVLEYDGHVYARVHLDIMVLDRETGERKLVVPKIAHHSLHTRMVAWRGCVALGDGVDLVVLESPVGPEIARVRLTGQVTMPVAAGERLLVAAKSHVTAFELS
jgi:outer membrane protein assembly factor BamB